MGEVNNKLKELIKFMPHKNLDSLTLEEIKEYVVYLENVKKEYYLLLDKIRNLIEEVSD
nr:MAG TPA: hypothetical protein [Caudoviricetes sp.]